MTVTEAIAHVKRVHFCGLFRDWQFEAWPSTAPFYGEVLKVKLRMPAPERNDDHATVVTMGQSIPAAQLASLSEHALTLILHRLVRDMAQHEADEAFLVDNTRPFDPHAEESGWEGRA